MLKPTITALVLAFIPVLACTTNVEDPKTDVKQNQDNTETCRTECTKEKEDCVKACNNKNECVTACDDDEKSCTTDCD